MERKSDAVRRLAAAGDFKAALRIAKGFRLGITPEERSVITRGYECIINPRFYRSIGVDPAAAVEKGVETVKRLYGWNS